MAAGRARRRALVIIGAILVVALAGSFGVMQQRRATASDRWVTATATTGSVTQTLSGSGTVAPAQDASASFPASGKVTAVKVSVGQTVKAGDVLATMDKTSLQTAVDQAALTLAQARETLAETETAAASASAASASAATASGSTGSSRSTSSASSSAASSKPTSSGSGASRTTTGSTASAAQQLQAQKKLVAKAQSGFDSAWAAFSTQLSTTTTACDAVASTAAVAPATPSASSAAVASTSSPSLSSPSSSGSAPSASGAASSAAPVDTQKCLASLDALAAKQDAVSSARSSLETAVDRIVALATASIPASSSTGSTTSPGGTSATSSAAPSTGSGSNAAGGSGSGQSSAAASSGTGAGEGGSSGQGDQGGESKTVAQAAAAVAQAKLDLATARVALTNATMTAPISGTISAVPFAVGDEASTSDTVDIVGGTGVTLSLPVGEDDIRSVKVGQSVEVSSVAGSRSEGTVSAIGVLASSGTTSEVTYPVTVEVLDAGSGLVSGTTASALVTIASARRATLVPVSAVTLVDDSTGIVKVVGSDHAVTATRVSLGAIGSTQVQITKGISSGATVALADSTSDLPTSGSTSTGGMGMGGGQGGQGGQGGGNAPGGQGGGGQGPR